MVEGLQSGETIFCGNSFFPIHSPRSLIILCAFLSKTLRKRAPTAIKDILPNPHERPLAPRPAHLSSHARSSQSRPPHSTLQSYPGSPVAYADDTCTQSHEHYCPSSKCHSHLDTARDTRSRIGTCIACLMAVSPDTLSSMERFEGRRRAITY